MYTSRMVWKTFTIGLNPLANLHIRVNARTEGLLLTAKKHHPDVKSGHWLLVLVSDPLCCFEQSLENNCTKSFRSSHTCRISVILSRYRVSCRCDGVCRVLAPGPILNTSSCTWARIWCNPSAINLDNLNGKHIVPDFQIISLLQATPDTLRGQLRMQSGSTDHGSPRTFLRSELSVSTMTCGFWVSINTW